MPNKIKIKQMSKKIAASMTGFNEITKVSALGLALPLLLLDLKTKAEKQGLIKKPKKKKKKKSKK